MDITEQIKDKIAYVKANYSQPKGAFKITKNGTFDVKNYATVNAMVEGGAWDGTNNLTIRFYRNYEDYIDEEYVRKTEAYNVSGYYTINGSSAIYFSDEHEIVLNKAVGVADDSSVYLYFWVGGWYSTSTNVTACEKEVNQYGDGEYEVRLYNFTGDATFEFTVRDY